MQTQRNTSTTTATTLITSANNVTISTITMEEKLPL